MSCLFNSLSNFNLNPEENSYIIRQRICDYLAGNPVLFDDIKAEDVIKWESNSSLSNYVCKMKNTSTWGGAIEIRCFCNLYNVNVKVVNIRDAKSTRILFEVGSYRTIQSSSSGGHYEPL